MDNTRSELGTLEHIIIDSSEDPHKLSYDLLRTIIDNFSNEIGRGGFGVVYMGNLRNERVAVKMITNVHDVSDKQFLDEIKCLTRAKHKNIVRFLGYCSHTQGEVMRFNGAYVMAETRKLLLCFEYVPNGNIQQFLKVKPYGDEWHMRYRMIKGLCHGLHYLHEQRITHLDLKLENVMLDANMEAKITDFGLSRFLDEGKSIMFTEIVRGTPGYIAPEIINEGELSAKSDIYALGIIIIKLLTGCNIINFENWDESLHMESPQVKTCTEIARRCIHSDQRNRPTIGEIVHKLHEVESMIQESTTETWSSIYKVSSGFPKTELLDVYPREVWFPLKSDVPIRCSLSLINQTDREVGYAILPYRSWCKNPDSLYGVLMPMSTIVVTPMLTDHQLEKDLYEELPWDNGKLETLMFIMRSNVEVREIMSTFFCDRKMHLLVRDEMSGDLDATEGDLIKVVQEAGGELHRAMLTSVVYDPTREATKYRFMYTAGVIRIQRCIEVHPTEPWVLISDDVGTATIWNWETEDILSMKPMSEKVKPIAQNHWVIAAGNGAMYGKNNPPKSSIIIMTWPALDEVKVLKRHDDAVTLLAVHPTRPFLLSASNDSIRLWDWHNDWSCIQIYEGHNTSHVTELKFNPKHTNGFATLGKDGRVEIWNIDGTERIATSEALKGARLEYVWSCTDERHMITAIGGSNLRIWDLKKDEYVHTLYGEDGNDHLVAVCCHPTCPMLATASKNSTIHVWDTTTYRLKKTMNVRCWPKYVSYIGSRRLQKEYMDLEGGPVYVAFLSSRSLMVGFDVGVAILNIDVE